MKVNNKTISRHLTSDEELKIKHAIGTMYGEKSKAVLRTGLSVFAIIGGDILYREGGGTKIEKIKNTKKENSPR